MGSSSTMTIRRPRQQGIHVQIIDKRHLPSQSRTFTVYDSTLDEIERVLRAAIEGNSSRRRSKQPA